MAKLLVESGSDVNEKGNFGETLLNVAIKENSIPIVGLLVDNGADIYAKSTFGKSSLDLAKKLKDSIIYQILKEGNVVKDESDEIYDYVQIAAEVNDNAEVSGVVIVEYDEL